MLIGLLEDDLAIQEMLCLLLRSEGYEVVAYASAEECLASLGMQDTQADVACPGLLMIDLHLEKTVSGLTIIEQIRANPRYTTLPIILMTASAFIDKQDLQDLCVTLLLKPFDIDETIRMVSELIRS